LGASVSWRGELKAFSESFLKGYLGAYNVEKSEITLAGVPAQKISFDLNPREAEYHYVAYILVSGKRGYVVETRAYVRAYETFSREIDAIVRSFKVIEAK
jgi:hypothetical protein